MKKSKVVAAVLACAVAASCAVSFTACKPEEETNHTAITMDATKTRIVVKGYEWGPAIPKIIVEFKGNVSGVTKDTFAVSMKTGYTNTKRTITDAYTCDENGNKVTTASKYVAIEMSIKYGEASPFSWDNDKRVNIWNNSIPVTVKINEGKSINVGDKEYLDGDKYDYTVTAADRLVPQTATWDKDTHRYQGEGKDITLSRASWTPEGAETDGGKNPLIIWLHGGGEGGTDIDIALLGNEVTGLTTENETNVQKYFTTGSCKGAYVLAVQSPTMWMDEDGTGDYGDNEANGTPTGEKQTSYYTEALWSAITDYVDGNKDIDTDRIYIGGCSNGGYMTMNLAFEHGDYFAAYYPVCEGYLNGNISDDMVEKIKDYNIWFLLSEQDNTLKPANYTLPLYKRLLNAGATNVHLTYEKNVKGTDDPNPNPGYGQAGFYDGHWSWIYAFNDQVKTEMDVTKITTDTEGKHNIADIKPENCTKEGNMWTWMAQQGVKAAEPVETYVFEAEKAQITDGKAKGIDWTKVDWAKVDWAKANDSANYPNYWAEFYADPNNYVESDVRPTVETGNKYTADGTTGDEVSYIGYFYGTGTKLTWKINAEEACDVTITLHAAAHVPNQTNNALVEVDLSQNTYLKLVAGGADVALTGTLPGITGLDQTTINTPESYRNFGTGTATVHLNAGENVIEIVTTNQQGGLNVDKIVISGTTVKLSYVPVDNSSRVPAQNPQG